MSGSLAYPLREPALYPGNYDPRPSPFSSPILLILPPESGKRVLDRVAPSARSGKVGGMSNSKRESAAPAQDYQQPFEFVELEQVEAPDGSDDGKWYRYVISQGGQSIVGHRRGTKKKVREAVKDIVQRMNERRMGRSGRVHLSMSKK